MNRTAVLSAYIDETERIPFAYGTNDCLLWLAGAVERLTGFDHAADYRGRYTTLAEGKRLVGMTLLRFVGGKYAPIHPSRAADGDIAALRQGREWAFGMFIGPQIYVQTEHGLGILPRGDAVKSFRIP